MNSNSQPKDSNPQSQQPLRQTPLTCSGHTRPVVFLAFSEFNPEDVVDYFCISACKDGKPMLRQGDTGDWIGTFEGHKGAVWGVDLNHNATRAATGAADFSAKIWDATAGSDLITLKHKHIVKSVNFSPSGTWLATGSNDKLLRIFDLEEVNEIDSDPIIKFEGHESNIKQVLFSNGTEELISCSDDKTIRFWDTRNGKETHKIHSSGSIGGFELSKEDKILTVAEGNKVVFYDVESRQRIKDVEVPTSVFSASLLKSKNIFVCGGDDFKLYKFDYETGKEIESFKGHFGPVHCVRFSPDGELYASGSEDGTLRLWQTEVGKTYGLWKCVDTIKNENVKLEAVTS